MGSRTGWSRRTADDPFAMLICCLSCSVLQGQGILRSVRVTSRRGSGSSSKVGANSSTWMPLVSSTLSRSSRTVLRRLMSSPSASKSTLTPVSPPKHPKRYRAGTSRCSRDSGGATPKLDRLSDLHTRLRLPDRSASSLSLRSQGRASRSLFRAIVAPVYTGFGSYNA